jgi:hypothetical protein
MIATTRTQSDRIWYRIPYGKRLTTHRRDRLLYSGHASGNDRMRFNARWTSAAKS